MTVNKGAGLYFHPVKDPVIEGLGKSIMTMYHAPLQEEVVLYLILDLFADKEKLPSEVVDYLASFHSKKTITVEEIIKEEITEIVKVMKKNEESGEEEEVEEEKRKMVPKKISKPPDRRQPFVCQQEYIVNLPEAKQYQTNTNTKREVEQPTA